MREAHRVVSLPGGEFAMGSDEHYPEEAPVHPVREGAIGIERHPVSTGV